MLEDNENHDSDTQDIGWQDYEELVKDIYQALGQASGVEIECWGNACRVQGQSGVQHQIDVLTSHSDGLHQYRTAISCKYWNEKVGKLQVMEFAQIVEDARLSKGIMVSKMGFTAPVKTYAEFKNIGLVELRKPMNKDWEGRIRKIHINMIIDQTEIYDIRFDLTVPKPGPGEEDFQGGRVNWPMTLNEIYIGIPDQEADTLQKLADEEQRKHPDEEEYSLRFTADSVVTFPNHPNHPANGCSVTGVSFKVRYNPPITEEIVISGDDHVYMIMESIFEKRRFTISKDGEIKESDFDVDSPAT